MRFEVHAKTAELATRIIQGFQRHAVETLNRQRFEIVEGMEDFLRHQIRVMEGQLLSHEQRFAKLKAQIAEEQFNLEQCKAGQGPEDCDPLRMTITLVYTKTSVPDMQRTADSLTAEYQRLSSALERLLAMKTLYQLSGR